MGTDQSKALFCDFPRVPTRSIDDFVIPRDAIDADSEHAKRAEESAMELSRLSLLGIAGYGFLLKEMAMANSSGLVACQKYAACLVTGAALLGLATSCALWTRELSIRCSAIQIAILRTFVKLKNGGWPAEQQKILYEDLHNYRSNQKRKLDIARHSLFVAHVALAAGTIVTVISFALVLFALKPEPRRQTTGSDVLIEQDRISVGIDYDQAAGTFRGLVGRLRDRHTRRFQLSLQVTNVGEGALLLSAAVPARIKSQHVLFEHAVKES
jgi:hypothetical protein